MPNYTKNYNLIKPKKSENYDIDDVTNKNMDSIDAILEGKVEKIPGKGLSENDFSNGYKKKIDSIIETKRGPYFYPTVDENGIISWENDADLDNPEPVNIRGPQGIQGIPGADGKGIKEIRSTVKYTYGTLYTIVFTDDTYFQYVVTDGITYYPIIDSEGNISWTTEYREPTSTNIKGPKGDKGDTGIQGPKGEPFTFDDFTPEQLESLRGPQGIQGVQGETGSPGPSNTITIGTVTKGEEAAASLSGESPNQVLNLILPKGDKGDKGATGEQGPKGDTGATGPANNLTIGTVESGSTAGATITGNTPNQVLNLVLPKGDKGDKGDSGGEGSGFIYIPYGETLVVEDLEVGTYISEYSTFSLKRNNSETIKYLETLDGRIYIIKKFEDAENNEIFGVFVRSNLAVVGILKISEAPEGWGTMAGFYEGTINFAYDPPKCYSEPTEEYHLVNKEYVDGIIGDISTLLDELNGEVI